MSDDAENVIRLASAQERAPKPSCTMCKHYMPRTDGPWGRDVVTWHRTWPFRRTTRVADSGSHMSAICTYWGGLSARTTRDTCLGEEWEPRDE
jgi:hypothetical protein